MARRKGVAALGYAMVAAAFLVIAIHTGPLASYSATGDFILTRIVARLAVPLFFLAVCGLSALGALPLVRLSQRRHAVYKPQPVAPETARAWREVDLAAIRHNAALLQARMRPGCRMMAVVKADAYGHGAVAVAHTLAQSGVNTFAVATLDEAIELRTSGLRGDILILGYTLPARAAALRRHNLIQTVCNADYAHALNRTGRRLRVHIKIDTGMHRLGEDWRHLAQIKSVFDCRNLRVEGCFTHLCVSDSADPAHRTFTAQQATHFYHVVAALREAGCDPGALHLQSSYGLLHYPQLDCDYARIGILLYGVHSEQQADTLGLRPALALRARVGCVGTAYAGESLGYGCAYRAVDTMRYAVVTIGYADGLPRCYAQAAAYVLIHGQPAPVVGRICMDQMMVDVTGIPQTRTGDVATIIGQDQAQLIRCEIVAAKCATITNDILAGMGKRLPIRYLHPV